MGKKKTFKFTSVVYIEANNENEAEEKFANDYSVNFAPNSKIEEVSEEETDLELDAERP